MTNATMTKPAPANETQTAQAEQVQQKRFIAPRVNIFESDDTVTIQAEMPGVNKDNVEIEIDEDELIIKGHRANDQQQGRLRFQERPVADFYRNFTIGKAVDRDKVEATMHDGILEVTLHKADHVKKRRITIQ